MNGDLGASRKNTAVGNWQFGSPTSFLPGNSPPWQNPPPMCRSGGQGGVKGSTIDLDPALLPSMKFYLPTTWDGAIVPRLLVISPIMMVIQKER